MLHQDEIHRQLVLLAELRGQQRPQTIPQPDNWRLTVFSEFGAWPGSDYYDVLELPDRRLLLVLATVSDRGAVATALTSMTRVVLHSCPLSSGKDHTPFCPFQQPLTQPPHLLLEHLNRILIENVPPELSMSAFCTVLNPADGTLHYANAGHPPPRWWQASQRRLEALRDVHGLPLGMQRHASFHHKRVELDPGDLLVLFSEGVTAAENHQGDEFGLARLDEAVTQAALGGSVTVQQDIVDELEEFAAGYPVQDDQTLIVLERLA